MKQEQIDELVEQFYQRLVEKSYFDRMFAEKKVDLNVLKERQKAFIYKLIQGDSAASGHEGVKQVQERHPFRTTPERAEIWIGTLRETMDEMKFEKEVKEPLLEKIQFLLNKMIES